jgi:hypothetical protein
MDSRTRERVEDWDEVPCAAGLDGLRELADDEFSGVVAGAGTWAFVLNGRIVGLSGGSLDALEDASLTAYAAPDPALPLLFAMQEAGGETQAKYYTNDTPIEEARETLSDGSFTGYVELSENVLSGDYYVCFYGGRALPVAFIGSSERLLTGDEAFQRANDEVGIYEVKAVEVDVVDLPEPEGEEQADETEGDAGTGTDAETGTAATPDSDSTAETERVDDDAGDQETETTPASDDVATGAAESATDPDEAGTDDEPTRAPDESTPDAGEPKPGTAAGESPAEASSEDGAERTETRTTTDEHETEPRRSTESTGERSAGHRGAPDSDSGARSPDDRPRTTDRRAERESERTARRRSGAGADRARERRESTPPEGGRREPEPHDPSSEETDHDPGDDSRFDREAEWRETTQIPSIDPDRSSDPDEEATGRRTAGRRTDARSESPGDADRSPSKRRRSDAESRSRPDRRSSGTDAGRPAREPEGPGTDSGRASEPTGDRGEPSQSDESGRPTASDRSAEKPLEHDMLEREDEIDRLKQRVSELETERETLQAERDTLEREKESVETENDRLQKRVQELEDQVTSLEAEIEELETAIESATAESESDAAATASRQMRPDEAISATNLFLRYESKGQATLEDVHAGDADAEALNANLRLDHHTSFDATDVAVDGQSFEEFLQSSIHYEFVDWLVRELPFEIRETGNATTMDQLFDVVPKIDRIEGSGTVEIPTESDDEEDIERRFDLVARDRMGHPLIIANLNDSLDPATEDMMVSLQESATAVKEAHDELGAAFMVTTSFFDPGALEVASEATSGSLLSRDSRKSFVKLSRKRGYHLCLVETREGNFYVNVPEL